MLVVIANVCGAASSFRYSLKCAWGLIGFTLLSSPSAGAPTNYYVATNGSDENAGTISQPFRSVLHAVSRTSPGDTIFVRGGTYDEGEVWIRGIFGQGGAPGAMLTIAAYPGEAPHFNNGNRPFIIDADFVRVEGLSFSNGKSIGIWNLNRNTVEVVGNKFTGPSYAYDAISTEGNNILLENNICDIQGNTQGTQGHCYYIHHGTNITVRGNIARGMTGYGIHVFDQRRSEDPAGFERLIKDVTIENNVTYDSEQRAGIVVAAYDHARVENVIIRNNVVFDNEGAGIVVRTDSSNVQVLNNTLFNNGGPAIEISGADTISDLVVSNNIFDSGTHTGARHVDNTATNAPGLRVSNNLYWPGAPQLRGVVDDQPVIGAPNFMDAAGHDFRLQTGSAGIDAGTTLLAVPVDIVGVTRPQGAQPDLGAFESQAVAADLNGDGNVDAADAGIMFGNWQGIGPSDLNADGIIDAADAAILFERWTGDGQARNRVPSVPEPLISPLALGVFVILTIRKAARS